MSDSVALVEQNYQVSPIGVLERAIASGAGVEVMERLLAVQERWEANQARKAFNEAIASAKSEIPVIQKTHTAGFDSKKGGGRTEYSYEVLGEIARVIDPILGKHGLSYRWRTKSEPNTPVTVTCIVSHRLGYSEETSLSAGRDESGSKNGIQAIGSAVTYLQRYTLKAALGLSASKDDDGHGITNATNDTMPPEPVAELMMTEAQDDDITSLRNNLGVSQEDMKTRLARAYPVTQGDWTKVTEKQAANIIKQLTASLEKRAQEQAKAEASTPKEEDIPI